MCALTMAACAVGPKYEKPAVATPPAFKEVGQKNPDASGQWKTAEPKDDAIRSRWWEVYQDPELNKLEEKLNVSNQTVAAAAANFLAARAMVREARSQYFPSGTTNPSIAYARPSQAQFGGLQSGSSSGTGLSVKSFTSYTLPFDASWEPDFWGRIRNGVRTNVFAAQASAADLENVRLSAQAELAADYYELRGQDALQELLNTTVAAFQESFDLTWSRSRAGLESEEAVAQAEAQLKAAEAQAANLGVLRAQYEHAIAVLAGEPPSSFSVTVRPLDAQPAEIPVGLPSELLERRPDIAAMERTMAEANAQIGVAKSAFFPNVVLSASGGLANSSFVNWLIWPSRFWSVGPTVAQTIFDAGLRKATTQQYRAAYDGTVANYRQTVLTAFEQVEDNLASLRILKRVIQEQDAAVGAAQRNLRVAMIRYQTGIDPYLNVITAQTILLNDQVTAVNYRIQDVVASVQLIKALGGGWDASKLPTQRGVSGKD
ncbi:MAG TPA: efflux transporter outer membrane subunit [Candidatus Methylomirabilis sp.]|nr:efflux transporter outer membrane subunit [Candidatus Methylomirabilis sp.]